MGVCFEPAVDARWQRAGRIIITIRSPYLLSIVFCSLLGYHDSMILMGIDFGTKRVGVATADTEAGMAFPKAVLKNDNILFAAIKEICEKEKVEKVILGESKDLKGEDNDIAPLITAFKESLEKSTGLEVTYQREFYTTYQASRIQGDSDMIDASAAAIILQTYLDKYKA